MNKEKSQKTSFSSLSLFDAVDGADKRRETSQCELYLNRESERGIALVVVLVLSAVSLALITALLYMITIGTQTSGMQKRYRTALEAGIAGTDIITQVIAQRSATDSGTNTAINTLLAGLYHQDAYGNVTLNASGNVPSTCSGIAYSSGTGVTFTGLAAKIMTSSMTWNNCGPTPISFDIDPKNSNTYDLMFQVGTNPQYNVYAKIVDVVEGNSSSANGGRTNKLILNAVVGAGGDGGGEITTPSKPYLYTIEVDAENTNSGERAKLSVLYQF